MNNFFSILNFPDYKMLMDFLNKHIICASGNDGVSVVSIVEISQNGMWWNVKPDWDEDNQKENSVKCYLIWLKALESGHLKESNV